jgi:hypothetical protein
VSAKGLVYTLREDEVVVAILGKLRRASGFANVETSKRVAMFWDECTLLWKKNIILDFNQGRRPPKYRLQTD